MRTFRTEGFFLLGRRAPAFFRARTAAVVHHEDVGRKPLGGGGPDRALFDHVTMLFRCSVHRGHGVPAVFTNQVHDLRPVKRSTLAVRVPVPATAQTRVEDSKEDVHDIPVSATRSQSCNLPDCFPASERPNRRNSLAVSFQHSRLAWTLACEKVFRTDPKSFLVLSSSLTNYRLSAAAASQNA